jgi:hypothetical protein
MVASLNGGSDGGCIFNRGGQALYRRDCLPLGQSVGPTAQTLNSQGLTEHAFDALMDVEPLSFEATALLNAASIMNRIEGEGDKSN